MDEISDLRREVEALRRENEALRREDRIPREYAGDEIMREIADLLRYRLNFLRTGAEGKPPRGRR